MDWLANPLGPVESWSPVLRTMTRGCLASSFPMVIHWGPQRVALYNDAFAVLLGGKHPAALGRPARETWPEAWEIVGGRLDEVMVHGHTMHAEDEQRILHGNGYKAPSYPQPSLWTPLSLRAVLGTALVMAIVAVLSLGIGTLVRRTAAAVTVVIAVVVLPRIIGAFLPVPVELWINRITPLAGLSIQQTRDRFDYALGPWQGLAVLCAWAAAALALAWWSLRRRDA